MKILISTFTFFPQVSGIANVTIEHAKHFETEGHQVTIVTSSDRERSFTSIQNIEIIEFDVKGGPLLSNLYRGEVSKYIAFLNNAIYEYDLIYFHGWQIWTTDLFLFVNTHRALAKTVLVSHCSPVTSWSTFPELVRALLLLPYKILLMPILIRKFDKLVFLSNKIDGDRQWDYRYALKKCPHEKIHIIENGIPSIDKNSKIDRVNLLSEWGINDTKIILYMANYDRIKDQQAAFKVFTKVSPMIDCHLVFIGGKYNKYSDKLLKSIKEKKVGDKVSVLSNLSRQEVLSFFSISYMTLFTSKSECYPLSILESIAYQKPVVSTNVGSVNKIPGVIVCDDIASLTRETELLLSSNHYYCNKVKEIGKKGELLSWPNVMKKHDQLIINNLLR